MFVVFGTKRYAKPLGYVADYCETCRRISEFTVEAVAMAPHVYFIRLGRGTFIGYHQTCSSCAMAVDSYPTRFLSIPRKRIDSIDELVLKTFPTIYEVFKTKLERGDRARIDSQEFDPAERKRQFLEVFAVASPYFKRRHSRVGLRVLVNGLHPLAPTEEELRECLSVYRDGKHSIGSLRSADLLTMVQRKELTTDCY